MGDQDCSEYDEEHWPVIVEGHKQGEATAKYDTMAAFPHPELNNKGIREIAIAGNMPTYTDLPS